MGRKCATNVFLLLTSLVLLNGIPIRRIEWTRQKKDNYWGDFTVLEGDTDPSAQPMIDHSLPPQTVEEIENITMNRGDATMSTFAFIDEMKSRMTCTSCTVLISSVMAEMRHGKLLERIITLMEETCNLLKLVPPEVCNKIIPLNMGEIFYVLMRIHMTAEEVCGVLLSPTCEPPTHPKFEWNVRLPSIPKPTPKPLPLPKEGAPTFKVLQIADTHFDPYYAEGSNAACDYPLCCRTTSGHPKNEKAKAGKWGDYRNCDTPNITMYNMFDHINRNHPDIDYILLTGDLVPHDVWNLTREENLICIQDTVDQMRDMLPNIPVFPSIGNHEAVPVNSFAPRYLHSEMGTKWLYDATIRYWADWLPESTYQTVFRGAFYSVLVRPGFRIISLNTNQCYNLNWWLLIDAKDPDGQLEWFIYELQNAELNNEKVHVIGHIPPGYTDCVRVWSRNYHDIITRFESTITAQFFGHTHFDEFEVFFDPSNLSRATNMAYIAPSVTPYTEMNFAYRIYYVDGDHDQTTRTVIDSETWIMDIGEANRNGYPTWHKEYSARKAFDMESLNPQDWAKVAERMRDNTTLFNDYYNFYWKSSPLKPKCDLACRKRMICDARSGRSYHRHVLCKGLL